MNLCLYPDCGKPAKTRGLCHNHYRVASHYVASGRTSWETLEASGRSLPAGQRGTKPNSWFLPEPPKTPQERPKGVQITIGAQSMPQTA